MPISKSLKAKINLRPLTVDEVALLKSQGNVSSTWKKIQIYPQTNLASIRGNEFVGAVTLGLLRADAELPWDEADKSSQHFRPQIVNCYLESVNLGEDNILIDSHLRNVTLGSRNIVLRVAVFESSPSSTYGVGTSVNVINEAGGRSVTLRPQLTSQSAYIEAQYRHDVKLQKSLSGFVREATKTQKQKGCVWGSDNRLRDCRSVIGVAGGDGARLEGIDLLKNGMILSTLDNAVTIEGSVSAENFIVGRASKLSGPLYLKNVFVGESVHLGKNASIEESVLFANSEVFRSELAAVFGGPFTVSHHASTLLIAGSWSFYNAGSGSNHSNHHYRLGAVHQGLLERGCKSGSSSYLLFPSRIAPYSTVLGRHERPLNLGHFPFSVLIGRNGTSVLYPGFLCFSAGQVRDELKWTTRDKRPSDSKDFLHSFRLSPFTIGKCFEGEAKIKTLLGSELLNKEEMISFDGLQSPKKLLSSGLVNYRLLIKYYFFKVICAELLRRAEVKSKWPTFTEPSARFQVPVWVDWAGLYVPQLEMDTVLERVRNGKIKNDLELVSATSSLAKQYAQFEYEWVSALALRELGAECLSSPESFFRHYGEIVDAVYSRLLVDGVKDFSHGTFYSYGIDGQSESDYEKVRGKPEKDKTLIYLKKEQEKNHQQLSGLKKQFGVRE